MNFFSREHNSTDTYLTLIRQYHSDNVCDPIKVLQNLIQHYFKNHSWGSEREICKILLQQCELKNPNLDAIFSIILEYSQKSRHFLPNSHLYSMLLALFHVYNDLAKIYRKKLLSPSLQNLFAMNRAAKENHIDTAIISLISRIQLALERACNRDRSDKSMDGMELAKSASKCLGMDSIDLYKQMHPILGLIDRIILLKSNNEEIQLRVLLTVLACLNVKDQGVRNHICHTLTVIPLAQENAQNVLKIISQIRAKRKDDSDYKLSLFAVEIQLIPKSCSSPLEKIFKLFLLFKELKKIITTIGPKRRINSSENYQEAYQELFIQICESMITLSPNEALILFDYLINLKSNDKKFKNRCFLVLTNLPLENLYKRFDIEFLMKLWEWGDGALALLEKILRFDPNLKDQFIARIANHFSVQQIITPKSNFESNLSHLKSLLNFPYRNDLKIQPLLKYFYDNALAEMTQENYVHFFSFSINANLLPDTAMKEKVVQFQEHEITDIHQSIFSYEAFSKKHCQKYDVEPSDVPTKSFLHHQFEDRCLALIKITDPTEKTKELITSYSLLEINDFSLSMLDKLANDDLELSKKLLDKIMTLWESNNTILYSDRILKIFKTNRFFNGELKNKMMNLLLTNLSKDREHLADLPKTLLFLSENNPEFEKRVVTTLCHDLETIRSMKTIPEELLHIHINKKHLFELLTALVKLLNRMYDPFRQLAMTSLLFHIPKLSIEESYRLEAMILKGNQPLTDESFIVIYQLQQKREIAAYLSQQPHDSYFSLLPRDVIKNVCSKNF